MSPKHANTFEVTFWIGKSLTLGRHGPGRVFMVLYRNNWGNYSQFKEGYLNKLTTTANYIPYNNGKRKC